MSAMTTDSKDDLRYSVESKLAKTFGIASGDIRDKTKTKTLLAWQYKRRLSMHSSSTLLCARAQEEEEQA
jgi:hypothetical protein